MKQWPIVLPDDDGIRPAGPRDACFYCRSKVGNEHARDCVTVTKKVRVRYSFLLEIKVPYFWGKSEIEFHRGESSWCANNAITELDNAYPEDGVCACGSFTCEVIDEATDAEPIQKTRKV